MIEDVKTGRSIATKVRPIAPDDLRNLEVSWRLNWQATVASAEVFKLIDPTAPSQILGLLALRRQKNFVEVLLLESHPQHVGKTKQLRGIPGSLFAFAVQLSLAIGGEGFLAIIAKTELIEHYRVNYGFQQIGTSQRMILDKEAAAKLVSRYGGRPPHE